MPSVTILIATQKDSEMLRAFALEAFARNFEIYGQYPPGLDSLEWHREQIQGGHCHRIMYDDEQVGGIYLLPQSDKEMKIDFFFIETKHQGKKIGTRVLDLIEASYPDVKKWSLVSPYKDYGNHRFYERHGFAKVGEFKPDERTDFKLLQYEKQL